MAVGYGDRPHANRRGFTISFPLDHDADGDRFLRDRRKRCFAAPALFLDWPRPPHLRPDCDLAFPVRHVAGACSRSRGALVIPLCLVLGDSTAVGTAEALAAQGVRCAVHAHEGAPSIETVKTWHSGSVSDRALVALGTNDALNPDLARNLQVLRRRVTAVADAGAPALSRRYHPLVASPRGKIDSSYSPSRSHDVLAVAAGRHWHAAHGGVSAARLPLRGGLWRRDVGVCPTHDLNSLLDRR